MKNKSVLNLTFNVLSLVISMGLSFWITPFIINSLGAESYGFVPLTQQLINYMTVITVSITAVAGRFYTIAKKQNNKILQQEYLSSTLSAGIVGSIALIIPLVIASIFIDKLLNIPTYLVKDVRISFLLYGGIFLMVFITTVFNVGAFSSNKLYITSTINIINIFVKTIVTIMLLVMLSPRIWYVSMGALVATLVVLIITIIAFKHLEPDMKICKFGFSRLREILSSGCWVSLSEIGVILFLQIDLLVANWNLGAEVAGKYAVVLQLPAILRTFSATIISIFVPTVISLFALNKIKDMIKYVNDAVKYTGLALSLPIGIVCGLGGVVLALWIGESYRSFGLLLAVLTIHLSINLSVQTVVSIQTAVNKLKIPAFVTLIMGAANFVLANLFSGKMGMGLMGIAIAGGIVLTAKNLVFSPLYVAKITNQRWNTYLKGVFKPFIATSFVAIISFLATKIFNIENFFQLIMVCFLISFVYLIFVWFVMLNKDEHKIISSKVGEFLCKN
ncbi:MAG: oligosaccharide flippase family protein [Oscillospiraceae bacterium]